MRLSILVATAAVLGPGSAQVHFNLSRQSTISTVSARARDLHGRGNFDARPVPLRRDASGSYFVTVVVGTPGQTLSLQVRSDADTTLISSSNATYCQEGHCSSHGAFNQNLSTTFRLGSGFFRYLDTYPDGTKEVAEMGYNFTDYLAMGDTVFRFGMDLCYTVTDPSGVFGIGYEGPEVALQKDNLAVQMVSQGVIPTEAYSLWLNGEDATAGSLLLGAIDTAKYDGSLIGVDTFVLAGYGLWVQLSSLEASSPSGTDVLYGRAAPLPVAVTVGVTSSWLPQDLAQDMWAVAGAEYRRDLAMAAIPCRQVNSAGNFSFRFGSSQGPLIQVPLRHFIIPPEELDLQIFGAGGDKLCGFSVLNISEPSEYGIGEDFMRAAYLVVDMYNQQIAMAQALYNVTESNVVPFVAHGASIPSATSAGSQLAATPTTVATTTSFPPFTSSTYAAAAGFSGTRTTSVLSTAVSTGGPYKNDVSAESSGLSTPVKAGMGVALSVGLICLAGLVYLLRTFFRKRHPAYEPEAPEPRQPAMAMPPKDPVEVSGSSPPTDPSAAAVFSTVDTPRPSTFRVSGMSEEDSNTRSGHFDWYAHGKYMSPATEEAIHELDTSR